jgi:hypothetical protein
VSAQFGKTVPKLHTRAGVNSCATRQKNGSRLDTTSVGALWHPGEQAVRCGLNSCVGNVRRYAETKYVDDDRISLCRKSAETNANQQAYCVSTVLAALSDIAGII